MTEGMMTEETTTNEKTSKNKGGGLKNSRKVLIWKTTVEEKSINLNSILGEKKPAEKKVPPVP